MIYTLQIEFSAFEIFYLIMLFAIGFIITYLITPITIKFMKKKGYIGIDIHKNSKPEVPESGGLSMVFGFLGGSIFLLIFFSKLRNEILIACLTIFLSGIIGFLDDRIKLKSRYKIGMTLFTGLLIFFANFFGFINIENPTFPIIGQMRLTILYPILIPLIVTVFSNTVNMLEGYNGEGSGTCLIVVGFLIICSLIKNTSEGLIFSILSFSIILAFFFFNKFPAKTFPGDVGTLTMGAMIASIAIFGGLEVVAFVALLTHVFNSFYYIISARGFFESSEVHKFRDDIILIEDDYIKASEQKNALFTMPRLILSKGPLKEPQLVKYFHVLTFLCGFLAIITTLLMRWTTEPIDYTILIITIIGICVVYILVFYLFPRIRDIFIHIILLFVTMILLLIFVDLFIISLSLTDLDLGFIKIPYNILISVLIIIPFLIVWYKITIKYFWNQMSKNKNIRS
ncbi:MAG: hypothetical protein KGD63_01865 [Candidatus Lokiarchaeota archaeon]|nr:hypothetical protein [Candidatus Lokiarchaeota archaeon]